MDLRDLDCSKMYFNPRSKGFVDEMNAIPGISKRKIGTIKQVNLYKYIVLMYDPYSPLVADMPDWWARKFEAVEASGFKVKADNTLQVPVERFLLGKNEAVNDAIIDYLAYINRPIWTKLIYLNEVLLYCTKEALGGKQGNTNDIAKIAKLQSEIATSTRDLMGEDLKEDTKAFKKRLYHRVEEARLAIRPEDYAKKIAGGSDLYEDSPYGEKYAVQRIKLIGDHEPK